MLAEWNERRLLACTRYADAALATGQLAVSEDECRDVLAATMDGAFWQRLVAEGGWTDEHFASWLGRLWASQLVNPDAGNSGEGLSRTQPAAHLTAGVERGRHAGERWGQKRVSRIRPRRCGLSRRRGRCSGDHPPTACLRRVDVLLTARQDYRPAQRARRRSHRTR
jgi:hypothetical protein